MTQSIFINYRREDAAPWAGRIYERLAKDFDKDQLFIDVDDIAPGADFVDHLDRRVAECDVFIAVIGKSWLNVTRPDGQRRLDDPNDFLRVELESALSPVRGIRVIPVLVDGAAMPRPEDLPDSLRSLTRRQAYSLTHARFGSEIQGLVAAVKVQTVRPVAPPPVASPVPTSVAAVPLMEKPKVPGQRASAKTTPPHHRFLSWVLLAGLFGLPFLGLAQYYKVTGQPMEWAVVILLVLVEISLLFPIVVNKMTVHSRAAIALTSCIEAALVGFFVMLISLPFSPQGKVLLWPTVVTALLVFVAMVYWLLRKRHHMSLQAGE